jgi:hypothetical protein
VSRWQQTESPVEKPSNIRTAEGGEGEGATWEINREERGRVCRGWVGRPAGSRAGQSREWGKGRANKTIDPVAMGLEPLMVH